MVREKRQRSLADYGMAPQAPPQKRQRGREEEEEAREEASEEGGNAPLAVVLLHGAGTHAAHPRMQRWKRLLEARVAAVGAVHALDLRRPWRMDRLAQQVERYCSGVEGPLLLVGCSMGGRAACHAAEALGEKVAGIACLGFPFESGQQVRDQVLRELPASTRLMCVSGTRDKMLPAPSRLRDVLEASSADAELVMCEGADHSFTLKKSERENDCKFSEKELFVARHLQAFASRCAREAPPPPPPAASPDQ